MVVVVIVVFDGAFVVGDDLVVVVGDRVFEDADTVDDAVVIFGDLVETRDVGIVGKSISHMKGLNAPHTASFHNPGLLKLTSTQSSRLP